MRAAPHGMPSSQNQSALPRLGVGQSLMPLVLAHFWLPEHCSWPATMRHQGRLCAPVCPQSLNAICQPVDAMQDREALDLLAGGLPPDQVATERANLGKLAARVGEWAQLLKVSTMARPAFLNS